MAGGHFRPPTWDIHHHFFDGTEKTVAYHLVLDSLNFCFWPENNQQKWEIEYQPEPLSTKTLSGYIGLAASLKMAVQRGTPITEADFLLKIRMNELRHLLGGKNQLPLMEERRNILNELGRALIEDFQGRAVHLVEEASGSARRLALLLAEKLDSFRDMAWYKDRQILFLKRAQIFAADLYGAFQGKQWGRFSDMAELTAFADYKLPQVLRQLGILSYGPELAQKVDTRIGLSPGSEEEVEIRANTIWAVECIRKGLACLGHKTKAFEIDWLLWNLGQEDRFRTKPYHRTITIFY
jgi:hypothetical protein